MTIRFNQILLLLTCLFGSSVVTAEDQTLLIGVRKVVFEQTAPKVLEWVRQAAGQLGYRVDYKVVPIRRSLKLAAKGVYDGEFNRHAIIEPDYPSLVRVDVPLDFFDYWVWVHEDVPCMTNREALAQLKPIGTKAVKFFRSKLYPISEVGYEEVESFKQIQEMLKRRRADYTVHAPQVVEMFSQQTGINLKPCLGEPLFSLPFFLYLHESHRHLVDELAEAMRRVKNQ